MAYAVLFIYPANVFRSIRLAVPVDFYLDSCSEIIISQQHRKKILIDKCGKAS